MASEGMSVVDDNRYQALNGSPDSILYLGVERAHDGGTSTWSLVGG